MSDYGLLYTGTRRRPTIKKSKAELLDAEDGDGDIGVLESYTYTYKVYIV